MLGINRLFDFQEQCVEWLLETSQNSKSKNILTVKSPTGSGKTIILLAYIEKYLQSNPNTAFIWLCPGKGNLEEQSKRKMDKYLPGYISNNLFDALQNGFEESSTTFINWELVTKKDNKAITESEKRNLFDAISTANLDGIEFMVIIDEEHSNNTKKADDIIRAFNAKHIIRVSATTKKSNNIEFYEVPEREVIAEGLITKAVYVNEKIDGSKENALTEYMHLIDLANKKRLEIDCEYKSIGKDIRPLVLIQMPNNSDDLLQDIEDYLNELGYNYGNKMVAKWLSNSKENLEGIEENNAEPIFMILKQAVATGWDCPRAKILVKLREGMGDVFTIQTVGRIRRMPEQYHYDSEILNYSYLYTFDSKYKQGLLSGYDLAFEPRRFFLKDKCKSFTMKAEKKVGNLVDEIDELKVLDKIYDYFVSTYKISNDKDKNIRNFEGKGYEFLGTKRKNKIISNAKVILTDELGQDDSQYIINYTEINTHYDGRDKMHSINEIAVASGMNDRLVKNILNRMFMKSSKKKYKIFNFNNREFYAFIINNVDYLKEDFVNASAIAVTQFAFDNLKEVDFKIPLEEIYAIDSFDVHMKNINTNAYEDYNTSILSKRSTAEQLFENWCERNQDVDWYYKNGDKGINYLSLIYNTIGKQREFYPDYILKLKNGQIWILETKGGEDNSGNNKNIDKQIKNKFDAFKQFAQKYNLNWGFVRDKQSLLYINNTIFENDLNTPEWKTIDSVVK